MNYRRVTYFTCLLLFIIPLLLISCSQVLTPATGYDPAKNYAAFLVLNSSSGKNILETIKQRSIGEKYEIGPVEFYNTGTTNFEPLIKKLTPSKQITLLWIASTLSDVPAIQKAIAAAEYKGMLRYMPVSSATGQ